MSDAGVGTAPARWTWADLFSTYTFWALLIVYAASMLCVGFSSFLIVNLRVQFHWSVSDYRLIFALRTYGIIFALWLAWITVRWKTKPMLLALALLQLLGFSLIVLPGQDASFLIRALGAACWGVGYYSLTLAITALLAGSLGGTENFVVAFGAMFTISVACQSYMPLLLNGAFMGRFGLVIMLYFVLPALVSGTLALLFLRRNLFHDAPPPRGYSFAPARRSPAAAALLSMFVPFYFLYWFYKVHGEVAYIAPSRELLSPRAAVGIVFVPSMGPIMLMTLADEMNRFAASRGFPRLRSPWATFFLTVFLAPVAIGLVQSALNKAADMSGQNLPPAAITG